MSVDNANAQCPPETQSVLDAIARARVAASEASGASAADHRQIADWLSELLDTREALAHASRLIVKGAERQGALQSVVERLENEAHDGGILAETMAEVHRLATDEPILGRSEITRILDGVPIDEVIPHPFDARLELRILGDLAHQLLSTQFGRRYDPAVTRALERLIMLDLRTRATPPTDLLTKKARAFDRVKDRLAEFGDDADTALRCIGEDIQAWDHAHPEDVTVGELLDGLDYDACLTGDCPHGHVNDCLLSLTKAIRWFCGEAHAALGLTGTGARVITHDGPALKFSYDRDTDVLTIEGVRFAGGLFRTLAWPRDDRWYRFVRQGPDLVVTVIDMPVRPEPPAEGNA